MSLKEFQEIFSYSSSNVTENKIASDEQKHIAKKANLLSRYVPRQSGRKKWRAAAGQTPTMIHDQTYNHLYEGDVVFHKDMSGTIKKLIVAKTCLLGDTSLTIKVKTVGTVKESHIILSELFVYKQQILSSNFILQPLIMTFSLMMKFNP